MTRPRSPFRALDRAIAADERGGVVHRWRYGRELLGRRSGRQRLPKGMLADLVTEAAKDGVTISEQELQRRMKLAETYPTEAHSRQALTLMGSWSAIVNAGFPPVPFTDPDSLTAEDIPELPDAWEQLTLIPGFGETIKVAGRRVLLAAATVGEAKAHREEFRQIHESFGKTLAQMDISVEAMIAGSDGDDEANAVEAWRRGTDVD
jgi:hypothetical protein